MSFLAAPAWAMTWGGVLSSAAALAGTGISAISSIAAGKQQAQAAKYQYQAQAQAGRYNQMVAEKSAQATEAAGRYAEEQQREKVKRMLGSQKVAYSTAGVTLEGTPLEFMSQTAADMEQEILATRYNYAVEAARARSQANYYGFEAERSQKLSVLSDYYGTQGYLKAGTALLTGLGNTLGNIAAQNIRPKYPRLTVPAGSDFINY